jgi:hypothetical protein
MKTFLSGLVLLNVLAIGGVAQVHAKDGDPLMNQADFAARAQRAEALAERVRRVHTYDDKINKLANHGNWERRGPSVDIPELDPKAAGAAIALLVGGAFVLVDRRKRVTA